MSRLLLTDYKSLAFCIFTSTLLLFPDVPLWCFTLGILFWLWRLFCHVFDFTIPSRTITGILSFLALGVVLLDFRTLMGKEPAASFIVILAGLKSLEFSEESEKDFLVLLGFFLISSKFLFSYDLTYLILSIPIYVLLTLNLFPTAWLKASRNRALLYLGKVCLLAVPMAALMFVFFPRITKKLMELPTSSRYGTSGFSESVSPGSISRLSLSAEIVMRVELFNNATNLSSLYFRGQSLEKNSQMTWNYLRTNEGIKKSLVPKETDYKIILEPHYRSYIFSLRNTERMMTETLGIYHDLDFNFRFDSFLEKKAVILASFGEARPQVNAVTIARNTKMPDMSMLTAEQQKQIQVLVSQLKGKNARPEQISKSILDHFSSNRFAYTLETGENPSLNLHDFLFKQKKGYCEHYASAMALLLRLSGVPARVVVGYHGGEFNPMGNFWTIRQKDAHAWVEYVNSQNNWIYVDPVSVVAPQRIELGSNVYNSIINEMLTEDEIRKKISSTDTISQLSMWFDNINYRWSTFLLEYDFDRQKDILKSLNLSLGGALVMILIALFIISVFINLLQKRGVKKKFSELSFNEINNWAAQFDLQKKDNEGPVNWLHRILQQLPEKNKNSQPDLEKAFSMWIQMSYQKPLSETENKRTFSEIRKIIRRA
ncbi:MAG: DUF3488 domain-containing transglutaminase family protein [Bdellovibrionaceae bacterium]|nr:DUF3488 domain-containing transglutaminase family protein [Pseudobdellovibrionaceae bacterium]